MRHFHLKRNLYYCPTMNLDELWSVLPEEAQEQAKKDASKAPVIDLTQHGVFKLLGRGRIERPVVVKTKFISSIAEKKIKAAGGACILTAETTGVGCNRYSAVSYKQNTYSASP